MGAGIPAPLRALGADCAWKGGQGGKVREGSRAEKSSAEKATRASRSSRAGPPRAVVSARKRRIAIGARPRGWGRTWRAGAVSLGPPRTMSAAVVAPPHLGAAAGAAPGCVGGGVPGPAAAGPHDLAGAPGAAGATAGAGVAFAFCAGFSPSLRGAGSPEPLPPLFAPDYCDKGVGGQAVGSGASRRVRVVEARAQKCRDRAGRNVPGLPSRLSERLSPRSLRPFCCAVRSKARRSGAYVVRGRDMGREPVSARRGVRTALAECPPDRMRCRRFARTLAASRAPLADRGTARTCFCFFPPFATTENFSTVVARTRG